MLEKFPTLPIYYSNASHFLLQLNDVISRRSFLLQVYFYLTNILTISELSSTIQTEVHSLQDQILKQLRKSPRGDQFVQCVKSHCDREKIWLEWKEKKMPSMVPEHGKETHQEYVCSIASRSEQDTRLLCSELGFNTPAMSDPDLKYMEYDPTPHESNMTYPGAIPPLETYEETLKESLNPENAIEEELRPYHYPVRFQSKYE